MATLLENKEHASPFSPPFEGEEIIKKSNNLLRLLSKVDTEQGKKEAFGFIGNLSREGNLDKVLKASTMPSKAPGSLLHFCAALRSTNAQEVFQLLVAKVKESTLQELVSRTDDAISGENLLHTTLRDQKILAAIILFLERLKLPMSNTVWSQPNKQGATPLDLLAQHRSFLTIQAILGILNLNELSLAIKTSFVANLIKNKRLTPEEVAALKAKITIDPVAVKEVKEGLSTPKSLKEIIQTGNLWEIVQAIQAIYDTGELDKMLLEAKFSEGNLMHIAAASNVAPLILAAAAPETVKILLRKKNAKEQNFLSVIMMQCGSDSLSLIQVLNQLVDKVGREAVSNALLQESITGDTAFATAARQQSSGVLFQLLRIISTSGDQLPPEQALALITSIEQNPTLTPAQKKPLMEYLQHCAVFDRIVSIDREEKVNISAEKVVLEGKAAAELPVSTTSSSSASASVDPVEVHAAAAVESHPPVKEESPPSEGSIVQASPSVIVAESKAEPVEASPPKDAPVSASSASPAPSVAASFGNLSLLFDPGIAPLPPEAAKLQGRGNKEIAPEAPKLQSSENKGQGQPLWVRFFSGKPTPVQPKNLPTSVNKSPIATPKKEGNPKKVLPPQVGGKGGIQ